MVGVLLQVLEMPRRRKNTDPSTQGGPLLVINVTLINGIKYIGKWGYNLTFWGDNSIYHWLGPTFRDVEGEGFRSQNEASTGESFGKLSTEDNQPSL